ncbi:hypothetical protein [Enterovirga aerilata]|uniref:Uncharacterized protein n=1 Tax=Enterovirga aerilata TaxID=2730920 RepID=A0A849HYH6_9HYPH|nr:hypothetical protein [Enterovirga sp. DB1703]NNM72162.1 hypothetical protein [Enterovirga sp. DB1703]
MRRLKLAPAGDFGLGEAKRGPVTLGVAGLITTFAVHATLIASRAIAWWVVTARIEADLARERSEVPPSGSPRRAVWARLL